MKRLEIIAGISVVGCLMMANEMVKSSQDGNEKEDGAPQSLVWLPSKMVSGLKLDQWSGENFISVEDDEDLPFLRTRKLSDHDKIMQLRELTFRSPKSGT